MVKNEADIVEPFVRHNLRYVDRMYVFDHNSIDGTSDLLTSLRAEGLSIELISSQGVLATGAKLQAEITTQLFYTVFARERIGTYVFLDADEFLHHPDGKAGMLAELSELGHLTVMRVPWVTHVIPEKPHESYFSDPPRTFGQVRRLETPQYFKATLNVGRPKLPSLRITKGNHDIRYVSGASLPAVDARSLSLRHVPVRSEVQVFQKAVLGWLGTLRSHPDARHHRISHQQMEIFDLICNGPGISPETLHRLSCSYAQDGFSNELIEVDASSIFHYERSLALPVSSGLPLVLRELERQAQKDYSTLRKILDRVESYSIRYPLLRKVTRVFSM